LCNVYLHGFDTEITGQGLRLVRYADDFVVLCRKRHEAQAAQHSVEAALKRLRLQLNPHKTRLVSFDDGFKFLGVFFLRNEHFSLA
jgi:CRISPR-associated protein Cas1